MIGSIMLSYRTEGKKNDIYSKGGTICVDV